MAINPVNNTVELGGSAYAAQTAPPVQAVANTSEAIKSDAANKPPVASSTDKDNKRPVIVQDVTQKTAAINDFLEAMNSTIRFKIHQKTHELMVQVVDQTTNKVIKEFPPHEFLDTMAAISSYVGMLLDKKI